MEAENRQLKLKLLQKDMIDFAKRITLLLELKKMKASMQQMVGRPRDQKHDFVTVTALNATYRNKYPNGCPTVITRGKRKGEMCGESASWGKLNLSDFGLDCCNEFDPCCDKHKWSAHRDYAAYKVAFTAAKKSDEIAHAAKEAEKKQIAAAATDENAKDQMKHQYHALLGRIDAQLQEFASISCGEEFDKLTKERASFVKLEKFLMVAI